MNNQITSLEVAGFKSIQHTAIELAPLNVIIGANGAGKSNLLTVFDFLRSSLDGRMDDFMGRHGGPNSILYRGARTTKRMHFVATVATDTGAGTLHQCVDFRPPDDLTYCRKHTQRFAPASSEVEMVIDDVCSIDKIDGEGHPGLLIYEHLKNNTIHVHLNDTSTQSPIRMEVYVEDNLKLHSDGGNLAAVLYWMKQLQPDYYSRIRSVVQTSVLDFDDFVLEPQRLNAKNILLNWRQRGSDYVFGPHQLSDGSLRMMVLTTLLLQNPSDLPGLILLDEPELGLHPDAISILTGLIQSAAISSQVIVSTQSPTFVDEFEPSDLLIAEARRGASVFRRLGKDELTEWLTDYSLGEVWQKNVVGGGIY